MRRPTALGSPFNCSCHSRSLKTTTRARFPSASVNTRPTEASVPNVVKYPPLARLTEMRAGSADPGRLNQVRERMLKAGAANMGV